ncbi:hypothetical protein Plhal304r1_c054g0138891 [Plasmopara halstedii]
MIAAQSFLRYSAKTKRRRARLDTGIDSGRNFSPRELISPGIGGLHTDMYWLF